LTKATNFKQLYRDFPEVIEIVDTRSRPGRELGTLSLKDGTKIEVEEYVDVNGNMTIYHYNWLLRNGSNFILKFHNEPHDEPKLRTVTEPHHIHVRGPLGDSRIANDYHRDLFTIIELVDLHFHAKRCFEMI